MQFIDKLRYKQCFYIRLGHAVEPVNPVTVYNLDWLMFFIEPNLYVSTKFKFNENLLIKKLI